MQGLRAVAVLLVVVYHVFTERVSGGVDIFLFISAFFLTLSFARKLDGGRPLALGRYWLHVFTRLMPLAIVTILVTLVLVATVYPIGDRDSWRLEGLASAVYAENWVLAFGAVDYYATDNATMSPFQHFWSLSVQGQVFLLWPLVFLLAGLVVRRTRLQAAPVLASLFATIFAVSLWWSVTQTAENQAFTYFDTRARLWEFALGSLVALAVPYLRPSRRVRLVLGWAGLASMVSVGMVVDVEGAFPGWIALWPLLSAAAVIAAGTSGSRYGLDRILSSRPLTALGGSAYALYLVHWPLLITYAVVTGRPQPTMSAGLGLVAASIVLAVLVTRLIERPLSEWSWPRRSAWRQAVVVGVCLALVAAPVGAWKAWDDVRRSTLLAQADVNNPGAAALLPGYVEKGDPEAPPLPVVSGRYPMPEHDERCPAHLDLSEASLPFCHVTVTGSDDSPVVLLLGNSHVRQWTPAFARWSRDGGHRLIDFTKGSCLLARPDEQVADDAQCAQWLEDIDGILEWSDPDLVVVQGTRSLTDDGEMLTPGMVEWMRQLGDEGRHVLALRDNPRFPESPTRCAQESDHDAHECAVERGYLREAGPLPAEVSEHPRISHVDLNDLICPDGWCRPMVGNVYLYWDNNHLTPNYVESLGPALVERMEEEMAAKDFRLD